MGKKEELVGKILSVIEEDYEAREILEKALEWEEKNKEKLEELTNLGFQWHDIGVWPQKLNKLVTPVSYTHLTLPTTERV